MSAVNPPGFSCEIRQVSPAEDRKASRPKWQCNAFMNALLFVCFDFACWCWSYFKGQPVCRPLLFLNPRIPSVAGGAGARACSMQENNAGNERGTSATKGGTGEEGGGTSRMMIETVGRSTFPARFLKPGKYSHVTWLGGNKAKY